MRNKGIHIMECKTLYCMSKKSLLIKYSMTLHVQEVLTILYCLQIYCLSKKYRLFGLQNMRIFRCASDAQLGY